MSTDRRYPPGTVPAATVTLILIGLLLAARALGVSMLLRGCDRPEPVEMIASPMPAASSTAIARSSAAVTASQSVRVTIRRVDQNPYTAEQTRPLRPQTKQPRDGKVDQFSSSPHKPAQAEEITIEVSQAITAAATSSAQASASIGNQAPPASFQSDHGRLGIIAATMPGLLAADLQLYRLDVSPVTRWLVDVPMEVGLDVAGNLEAGAVGVSAGGKAFVLAGGWSRWNLSGQGLALGLGLRF